MLKASRKSYYDIQRKTKHEMPFYYYFAVEARVKVGDLKSYLNFKVSS